MPTPKNNSEVAHFWANQTQASGRGSHFYFEGDTIYSYGSHFPIARHYKGHVLFTTDSYSVSTSRHMGEARHAIPARLKVFYVSDPTRNPSAKDLKHYKERIEALATKAGRARKPAWDLECLTKLIAEANDFAKTFGFKTRFKQPGNLAELVERAKASEAKERAAAKARQTKIDAENADKIKQWLAGVDVSIPYSVSGTYLRARLYKEIGNEYMRVETSRGAAVPLPEAERAFRFALARREKGWHRNGEQFKIGDYSLDAVNAQGVVAGCHRFTWAEIERFAKEQGWV